MITPEKYCEIFAKIERACDEYLRAKRKWYSGGLAIRSIEEYSITVQYTSTCMNCTDNEYENIGFSDLGMSLRQMINETA